ncbi:MAG: ABC transporter substrate-binding protein [Gammaproteobacteria bacterium]|nr:ABC transporter substrate-binding protein [Gammaproteobacteria bacterium]
MKKHWLLCLVFVVSITHATTKPEKLSVALDWFINPDHAPLIVAQQQGFFKEQGLEVELLSPSDPTDPPKWVTAKKADIGITYEPEFMEQVDHGLPLIRIGTLIDKPLDCIVALKESGIKTVEDLKNKKIGMSSSGLTGLMLRSTLAKAHIKANEVELVNVRYNLMQALLSKKVDAVTGMMRNFEVPQLESLGHPLVTFFPEDHGVPNYSVLIFIAHTAQIKDNRFPRFLAAIKKAVEYLDNHPQQTWEDFIKIHPESNNAVNKEAWFSTLPYFAEDPGALNSNDWRKFAEFMFNNKMIKSIQPISRYAVVLPEIHDFQLTMNEPPKRHSLLNA